MHCNCAKQKSFAFALRDAQSCLEAHWVDETASTNDDVKEWVRNAQKDVRIALVADRQSAGRIGSVNRFCAAFCFARLYIGPSVGSGRSLRRIALDNQRQCAA